MEMTANRLWRSGTQAWTEPASQRKPSGVKDFLLQSDCAGEISKSTCIELYDQISSYDNNIVYGFRFVNDKFGNLIRQECGFQDFVELIKECINADSDLFWS